nr:MAG TPA: hypothetical protein [Caudoviricetes sp.]
MTHHMSKNWANININRRTGQMTILPTRVVCLIGDINLKVINSFNDIQIGVALPQFCG